MRMNTAIGKFFTCLAAMLLIVLPASPAFAADAAEVTSIERGASFVLHEGTMVKAMADDEGESVLDEQNGEASDIDADADTDMDADAGLLDQAAIPTPFLLEAPVEDPGNPTVAEREQSGPQTPDTSKEAISQAATHIATPEQALTAKEATIAVGEPTASAELKQTGDSLIEGVVVALGGVVVVAFGLLLYHFRKE